MRKATVAAMLFALATWAIPVHAATAQLNKEKPKTKPPEDLITQDLVIKDNAIIAPTNLSTVPKSQTSQSLVSNQVHGRLDSGRYYSANGDIQILAKEKVIARWSEAEWPAFHYILDHESGSNPYAVNPSSGACGIPQALPCSKLLSVIGSLDNIPGQLDWMINYIAARYGTPTQAMYFHQTHHWY